MIYCAKHTSRSVLGRCGDCEKLRDIARRRQRFLEIDEKLRQSAPHELELMKIWPFGIVFSWLCDAMKYLKGPTGYRFFVPAVATLVGAYFGLYAVLEARHERGMNRALFERATFMSMISSGNRGSIVAALKNFGPIQTILIPSEPALWPPLHNWFFSGYQPNIEPMWIWALNFFPLCTKESCGNTHINQGYRLDLQMAKLSGAKLKEVDLHDTILRDADLSKADLRKSNLERADLRDAILDGTDLREARMNKTDLSYGV